MHSLVWFWTTGIHDPAWVQAVVSIALVVLTLVTLIVLARYAWDSHDNRENPCSLHQTNTGCDEKSYIERSQYQHFKTAYWYSRSITHSSMNPRT